MGVVVGAEEGRDGIDDEEGEVGDSADGLGEGDAGFEAPHEVNVAVAFEGLEKLARGGEVPQDLFGHLAAKFRLARLDWQLGATSTLFARAGYASWKERGWYHGEDLASGAGSGLDARDGSGAVSVTTSGTNSANE